MERKQFLAFRRTVETANQYSDVWYAGYLWLDLNKRQCDEIKNLLKVHPSIVRDGNKLITPSGITIKI